MRLIPEKSSDPITRFAPISERIRRTTAFALIAAGKLERAKLGSKTLITQRSLDALIEQGITDGQGGQRLKTD